MELILVVFIRPSGGMVENSQNGVSRLSEQWLSLICKVTLLHEKVKLHLVFFHWLITLKLVCFFELQKVTSRSRYCSFFVHMLHVSTRKKRTDLLRQILHIKVAR